MYPQSHLLFPLLIGLILEHLGYVSLPWIILAVLVGVFVDIDHPLKHFFLTGEIGLHNAWNASVIKHEQDRTFIHHKEGILAITFLHIIALAYFPYWTLAVALGFYSHMLLDHLSLTNGLVDYITDKQYLGKWKPLKVKIFGWEMHLAKHEIVFDLLLVLGLIIVLLL
ncbi:hypothetical protein COV16_06435 [Candidatus Woesearchaeota archaeon CG10_big_fil_rev_8_21_14_0_10_34_8]|nr:MAG: hypothetical protein COV16_06435 [Candidatus Woesearchaeota archaeon CG10_big_fil_rev_8_21_14_0_10_34_8]